jgi:adenylate cyclase
MGFASPGVNTTAFARMSRGDDMRHMANMHNGRVTAVSAGKLAQLRELPMPFEIERKFLVRSDTWRNLATERHHIRQAYLASQGKASIRVRIRNRDVAALTIKSRTPERRRLELEYPIPVLEAEALIALRQGSVIEKDRYIVPHLDKMWEVDVFAGENARLVIAEIELRDENERVVLPPWVGLEVTGQAPYYNSSLAVHPFSGWPHEERAALGG